MIYQRKRMVVEAKRYTPETHYEVMAWLFGVPGGFFEFAYEVVS